jgi:hypothetical protein
MSKLPAGVANANSCCDRVVAVGASIDLSGRIAGSPPISNLKLRGEDGSDNSTEAFKTLGVECVFALDGFCFGIRFFFLTTTDLTRLPFRLDDEFDTEDIVDDFSPMVLCFAFAALTGFIFDCCVDSDVCLGVTGFCIVFLRIEISSSNTNVSKDSSLD